MLFNLKSPFEPTGDQPQAIEKLTKGLFSKKPHQTLLGVTGSGKTFTMAQVIARSERPTLIISHNKTLAAQLASEFREFFPENAVHYFVSYYDYYLPESYIPSSDTYIEKETQLNEEIDRLRHASTQSLLTRKDVIIVASVSCIYGLGSPKSYLEASLLLEQGKSYNRKNLLESLIAMQYKRNDIALFRGMFRVKGEVVDVFPPFADRAYIRLHFFGDVLEKISIVDFITNTPIPESPLLQTLETKNPQIHIFPATHYIASKFNFKKALKAIRDDMTREVAAMKKKDKLLEAQRLEQRTKYDLEMLAETGFVNGIENYSRYFDDRKIGEPPQTLIDFFPKDFLLFIDESHMTVPQIGAMYAGDQSRKRTLVDYGFRLKAALDNRPLNFSEFTKKVNQVIYVSATPAAYELELSKNNIVEQLVRPTGLLDPIIEVRPSENQIDHLIGEIRSRVKQHERVLITTLTKRIAEELTEYLDDIGIKVQYIHSEVETLERIEILRDLRLGKYDVLVGINLLREGLDLPEVSLIAILDADKEGFLRSQTSLVQTIGRAARHSEGKVIMYADKITRSIIDSHSN